MKSIRNEAKLAGLLFLMLGFSACKKNAINPGEKAISPLTGTAAEMTLDSIYLYALQTYLWNDALPSYLDFNPRKYNSSGSDAGNFKQELFDISQLKKNPLTGAAYEEPLFAGVPKYSFIEEGNTYGSVKAAISLGTSGNDLGLEVAAMGAGVYVSVVNPGSAADQAGLQRGFRLAEINGQAANPALAENALKQSQVMISYEKPDGSKIKVTLDRVAYKSHGVLKSLLLNLGGQKIGYLSLAKFDRLNEVKSELDQAFQKFSSEQPQELVIDLRYNGGGYVETAEYLANLMVSSAMSGKVMYAKHFNTLLQQGKGTILQKQLYFDEEGKPVYLKGRRATMADVDFTVEGNTTRFNKQGALERVKNIYFIVSNQTASASEFLINSLRPYFNVKLAGSRTYGKPVGFFGINIHRYTVYLSNFLIKNSANEGEYYSGFLPDLVVADDVGHDFGDPEEQCLKSLLSEISSSSKTGIQTGKLMGMAAPANTITSEPIMDPGFSGMITTHFKLKKMEN